MDSIHISWSEAVALASAPLFYSTSSQVDTPNHISPQREQQ